MVWVYLVAAGILEIVWAYYMKQSAGFTRVTPTVITLVAMIASFWLLSLSFWRDEEAVKAWRNTEEHRQAQRAGRGGVFADYRLRIAHVVRDYGMTDRAQAPDDSKAAHKA